MATYAEVVEQADRDAIAALGEPVTYTPTGGPAKPLTGIFDDQFLLAKGTADAGVEARAPAVFMRLSDLPRDPEQEDDGLTLTIRAVQYRVIERLPDDMGGIVLVLRSKT